MYLQLVRAFWCLEQRYHGPVLENAPRERAESRGRARAHHTRGSSGRRRRRRRWRRRARGQHPGSAAGAAAALQALVWLVRSHPEPNLTQPEIGLVRQLRLSQSPDATICRPRSLLPACHPRSLHVGDRGSCARFDAQHGGEQDCYPSEARHGEWRQASTRDKEEGRQ